MSIFKKKKEFKGDKGTKDKKPLLNKVPCKIIKKRGDSLLVEKAIGTISSMDKESEVPTLVIDSKRQLDNFDRTRVNSVGELVLVEKADGQVTYGDVDKDVVTSTGEGQLRDGYFLNREWIDRTFPIEKDKLAKWIPVIIVFFGIIAIGVSSYLTYNYYKDLNKKNVEIQTINLEAITQVTETMEKISRSLETSIESQQQIAKTYQDIVVELRKIEPG